MPVLKIPTSLRFYVSAQAEIEVDGKTAAEAMASLFTQFPALRPHLTNSSGGLRPFVNLFLDEIHLRDLQGLETPLGENDCLVLLLAGAGG
jgi:hypothetical protein